MYNANERSNYVQIVYSTRVLYNTIYTHTHFMNVYLFFCLLTCTTQRTHVTDRAIEGN